MEIIRGKETSFEDSAMLTGLAHGYKHVHVDLGTGDGRYVKHMAQRHPKTLVIGVDACRENLVDASRKAPKNALFVIANAQALPVAFSGIASHMTVNFPWGSLIEGLLMPDSHVIGGISQLTRPSTILDIHLNAGALAGAGWSFDDGVAQVYANLRMHGYMMQKPMALTPSALKAFPTTWAKRLAYGRDPRAVQVRGMRG